MLDIGLPGHIVCNGEKAILLLSNNFECFPDINFNLFIHIAALYGLILFEQLNQLDNNIGINLAILTINTLLLACKMNSSEHDEGDLVLDFDNVVRLEELLGELNDLLINALLLAL